MNTEIEKALLLEATLHPKAQAQDMVKLVVQSCLGVAHLHIDQKESLRLLLEEKKQRISCDTTIQYIGNGLCRVPLGYMKDEHLPFWNMLFIATQTFSKQDVKLFEDALSYVCDTYEGFDELRAHAHQGVHHSELYRGIYRPSYRVIKYAYILYFDVLLFVWQQIQTKSEQRIGIDGRCASGKSTISILVEEVFSLRIFHMDDYFLPLSKRNKQRLHEIGGNIDYERFCDEILKPLQGQNGIRYKRYNCQFHTFSEEIQMPFQTCTIWEGSYAHHPYFQEYMNARIFLTCKADIQKKRLKKRSSTLYDRFIEEWIPMEEAYFKTYHIQEKSDLVFDTSECR